MPRNSQPSESSQILFAIGQRVGDNYEKGTPVTVEVWGKPSMRIDSMEPLVHSEFGFRNKAPKLAGEFALMGFLAGERADGTVVPYGIVDAGEAGRFAVKMPAELLQDISEIVEIPIDIVPNRK